MSETLKIPATGFSAILLAGGRASRMGGVDKLMLQVEGLPLLDRALGILGEMFEHVIVASGQEGRYADLPGVMVVPDRTEGCGPLAGIQAGLEVCRTEWAFVVAADMPSLVEPLISRVVDIACVSESTCVLPRHDGLLEPLHAAYRRSLLPDIDSFLREGRRSVVKLLDQVSPEYIDVDGEWLRAFHNVNTPEDLIIP